MTKKQQRLIEKKRVREQKVMAEMLSFYCRKDTTAGGPDCADCPFSEENELGLSCRGKENLERMRSTIREAMRFSGPRMSILCLER